MVFNSYPMVLNIFPIAPAGCITPCIFPRPRGCKWIMSPFRNGVFGWKFGEKVDKNVKRLLFCPFPQALHKEIFVEFPQKVRCMKIFLPEILMVVHFAGGLSCRVK